MYEQEEACGAEGGWKGFCLREGPLPAN